MNLHEGDDPLGFLAHLAMALPSDVHHVLPASFEDCSTGYHPIVEALASMILTMSATSALMDRPRPKGITLNSRSIVTSMRFAL